MRRRGSLLLLVAVLLGGCGHDPTSWNGPYPRPVYPPPTTPVAVMLRIEKTFENKDAPEYTPLLTADFRYKFSADVDPQLVAMYPDWGRDDEVAAVVHWFDGFTNSVGDVVPAVTRIQLTFTGVQFETDPDHPDSTTQYQKVVVGVLDGTVEIPADPDPLIYQIDARHDFYLVRGDAAVLPADAPADTLHWYLRRWEDLAVNPFAGKKPDSNAASAATLGRLRAYYRN